MNDGAAKKLDAMEREAARAALMHCCGATKWVASMLEQRPFRDGAGVERAATRAFVLLKEKDWLEAFGHHPKIGDLESLRLRFAATAHFAGREQAGVHHASEATLKKLQELNAAYEARNGFIFIVCASGRSAAEMLGLLETRMTQPRASELETAAREQQKITVLRMNQLGEAE